MTSRSTLQGRPTLYFYLEPLFQFFELFVCVDGAIGRLDAHLAGPNG